MRRIKHPKEVSAFVMIGASLMIFIKLFVMGEYKYVAHLPKVKAERTVIDERYLENSEVLDAAMNMPEIEPEPPPVKEVKKYGPFLPFGPPKPEVVVKKEEPPPPLPKDKAYVVIIIDDMGMSRKRAYEVINLPGPLTLAFLPYAPRLEGITKEASDKGHELMIHVPMEPMQEMDPGPLALLKDMPEADFDLNLQQMFNAFSGYKGINNHMGSKLTKDRPAMDRVMEELAKRDLYFVDSKTIGSSVAAASAAAHGLRFAERDIFLDHQETPEFARQALAHLERVARSRGVGIAIGHPKEVTINALKEWIPTLKSKNIELIPVSKAVHRDSHPGNAQALSGISAAKNSAEKIENSKAQTPDQVRGDAVVNSGPAPPQSPAQPPETAPAPY